MDFLWGRRRDHQMDAFASDFCLYPSRTLERQRGKTYFTESPANHERPDQDSNLGPTP
jgi:hypothetical protein